MREPVPPAPTCCSCHLVEAEPAITIHRAMELTGLPYERLLYAGCRSTLDPIPGVKKIGRGFRIPARELRAWADRQPVEE